MKINVTLEVTTAAHLADVIEMAQVLELPFKLNGEERTIAKAARANGKGKPRKRKPRITPLSDRHFVVRLSPNPSSTSRPDLLQKLATSKVKFPMTRSELAKKLKEIDGHGGSQWKYSGVVTLWLRQGALQKAE
jgi:hypothetical protein